MDASPGNRPLTHFLGWLTLLVASLLVVRLLPAADATRGMAGYLPLHILMEVAAISVAAIVFGIAWSVHRYRPDGRAMVLGVSFLGVALLDLSHTLSFAGMPDFFTPSGPEKGINFWLAARTLAAVAFVAMAFWPRRWDDWLTRQSRVLGLLIMLVVVVAVHGVLLVYPQHLPRTYIQGEGLTPFKIGFEYVLIGAYLLAGAGFLVMIRAPDSYGAAYLALASFTMAMSEYFFTLYANVTDVYNVVGHLYKIVAYAFLYRALFVETVQRPYEALLATEEQQRATLDTLPDLLFEVDASGRYLSVHARDTSKLAEPTPMLVGHSITDVLPMDAVATCMEAIQDAERTGSSRGKRITLQVPEGLRHFELSISKKWNRTSQSHSYLVLSRDVTATVESERKLQEEARLNEALLDLKQHQRAKEPVFLAHAAERIRRITGSEMAVLHWVNESQDQIEPAAHASRDGVNPDRFVHQGIWWGGLRQRRVVLANQRVLTPYHTDRVHEGIDIRRSVSLPVMDDGVIRLLVGVANRGTDYGEQDVVALQLLGDALWSGLREQRQAAVIHRLSEALDQSPNPVIITDTDAAIQYVNQAFTDVSGYTADDVMGKNPRVLQSGQTPRTAYAQMWERLRRGEPWQGEFINRRKDGMIYYEDSFVYPIQDAFGQITHYVAHKEDVTLQREAQARIQALSDFDTLTGLYNKKAFDEHLLKALEEASRLHQRLALLWIDLDHFKAVNDTMGHDAGDELLVEMANRLRASLGTGIEVARYSGDAFAVIVPGADQSRVALLAKDVLASLGASMTLGGGLVSVSASVGISVYPDDAHAMPGLVSAAEMAMYRVKQEGRNGMRFYSPDMQEHTQRSLELAAGLKGAAERGELFLVYQPQQDLATGQLVGAEALLRWRHPKWGLVSPAEFIPMAEDTGLIVPVGAWVFEQVAHQIRRWDASGLPRLQALTVAVNVSAVQFARPHLVDDLLAKVAEVGVSPQRFEVELTEAVTLKAPEQAARTLQRLHEAGFNVALDDFGTGYSSMSYLKRYRIDKLKIDQSFVTELASAAGDQAIVRAIVQMAHTLGIQTIAEGVETPEQVAVLSACGCDQIQGYGYSRPLSPEDFEAFVRRQVD